jgi:hypothetical protein
MSTCELPSWLETINVNGPLQTWPPLRSVSLLVASRPPELRLLGECPFVSVSDALPSSIETPASQPGLSQRQLAERAAIDPRPFPLWDLGVQHLELSRCTIPWELIIIGSVKPGPSAMARHPQASMALPTGCRTATIAD